MIPLCGHEEHAKCLVLRLTSCSLGVNTCIRSDTLPGNTFCKSELRNSIFTAQSLSPCLLPTDRPARYADTADCSQAKTWDVTQLRRVLLLQTLLSSIQCTGPPLLSLLLYVVTPYHLATHFAILQLMKLLIGHRLHVCNWRCSTGLNLVQVVSTK
jgi:hypothetical protein